MPTTDTPSIAALVPAAGQSADPVLRQFVDTLRARGVHVRGLLQEMCPDEASCKFSLVDIETGSRYPISQNLGRQSTACVLDPAGIAEASIVMRRIASEGAELAIFNRFSGLEADGDGFAAEMLDLMSAGIPVLTIVNERHLPAWRHFTGGMAVELPDDPVRLQCWFSRLSG
ncbi:MAG: DUF2478 domain-containing protein [Dechloromonas sp.]|nr:DUF2478 domain-containing protein [Dechloromonas sp.]